MADWSTLPKDIVDIIARRLVSVEDQLRIGAVCSSWRLGPIYPIQNQFPGLVVPGRIQESKTRRFLKLLRSSDENRNRYYEAKEFVRSFPVPHRYYCCGSSLGWLVLIDDLLDMHLLNPLSERKFPLPSLRTLPTPDPSTLNAVNKFYVSKAVMSNVPSITKVSDNTIVFIVYGYDRRLAFCRPGSKSWTAIECTLRRPFYKDPIYYQGKFYVSYGFGGIDQISDVDGIGGPTTIEYVSYPQGEIYAGNPYIVESKGGLFLVVRKIKDDGEHNVNEDEAPVFSDGPLNMEDEKDEEYNKCNEIMPRREEETDDEDYKEGDELSRYRTVGFCVYKLVNMGDTTRCWKKVENIGDCAFFVGYNSSFSVLASDFMECRPNSIYFTDDESPTPNFVVPIRHDIGIFNLEDKSVEPVMPFYAKLTCPPAFWFVPIP